MKHFFIILSLLLTISVNVEAQNIIIGDKMPEISVKKWLMDSEPSAAEYSCILFYHSKSDLCRQTLATIKQHVKKQVLQRESIARRAARFLSLRLRSLRLRTAILRTEIRPAMCADIFVMYLVSISL